jgi:hypothetical protein
MAIPPFIRYDLDFQKNQRIGEKSDLTGWGKLA